MSDSHQLDRRDFVKIIMVFVGTVIGTIVGLPAIGFLISPATKTQPSEAWIPLGPLEKYETDTPTLFSFTRSKVNGWEKTVNSYGAYVVRKSDNSVTVFSNMCTHLACRVKWVEDIEEYVCPCHDAHFNAQGEVVFGPPPQPMIEYETKIEEGNLFIHFVEA